MVAVSYSTLYGHKNKKNDYNIGNNSKQKRVNFEMNIKQSNSL